MLSDLDLTGQFTADFSDHFWFVIDSGKLFSSAKKGYISESDGAYRDFAERGGLLTRIATESELREVLAKHYPEGWPSDYLVLLAKERLAKNDLVATRCVKDGRTYNAEWRAYDEVLRNIVAGRSTLTTIPEPPEYPTE
jgi:hypothetical protein